MIPMHDTFCSHKGTVGTIRHLSPRKDNRDETPLARMLYSQPLTKRKHRLLHKSPSLADAGIEGKMSPMLTERNRKVCL